jgi:hypothetical protein
MKKGCSTSKNEKNTAGGFAASYSKQVKGRRSCRRSNH